MELNKIQNELKAPKNQYNKFGGYRYRSCEDILEAVKPILAKHGCTLTMDDEVILIGARYYVKATCILRDKDEVVTTHAFAREEEVKKGMDASQITGASSSYARKYALNALFLIDDTADPDTDAYQLQQQPKQAKPKQVSMSADVINGIIHEANSCTTPQQLAEVYKHHAGKGEWCERLTETFKELKKSRQWN